MKAGRDWIVARDGKTKAKVAEADGEVGDVKDE